MIIAKPVTNDKYFDERSLFILPYTTLNKGGEFIELYYCIIENPNSTDNTIFNFSILTDIELKELFGVEIDMKNDNLLDTVSDKVMENIDDIISLKKSNANPVIIKKLIKELLRE